MKTLNEFIKEIEASKELQEELKNLKNKDAAVAFLKKHDCGATVEELTEFIKSQANGAEGELSDDEASSVAGGVWFDIGFGRFWVDETLPDRKTGASAALPEQIIEIIDDD